MSVQGLLKFQSCKCQFTAHVESVAQVDSKSITNRNTLSMVYAAAPINTVWV